jgi:hypothetical protein
MENLTSADIANLIETEVQRRLNEAGVSDNKDNGQLTREQLNDMSWQEIAQAKANGRLDNIMLGKGE